MSYLFHADTILYNAFYAVKDKTDVLTTEEIYAFCSILDKNIQDAFSDSDVCCNVVFDLNWTSCDMRESAEVWFIELNDKIVNLGSGVTDADLDFINCHFSSPDVLSALSKARKNFSDYIGTGEEYLSENSFSDYEKKLTVI